MRKNRELFTLFFPMIAGVAIVYGFQHEIYLLGISGIFLAVVSLIEIITYSPRP